MFGFEKADKADDINITDLVTELRRRIGELPDAEMPTKESVEAFVAENFDYLPENQQAKLVEAFMQSEKDAADEADRLAS